MIARGYLLRFPEMLRQLAVPVRYGLRSDLGLHRNSAPTEGLEDLARFAERR
jgi:hypothetical protein